MHMTQAYITETSPYFNLFKRKLKRCRRGNAVCVFFAPIIIVHLFYGRAHYHDQTTVYLILAYSDAVAPTNRRRSSIRTTLGKECFKDSAGNSLPCFPLQFAHSNC